MITLSLEPILTLTQQQFYQLCQLNPDTKLELTAQRELEIMSPTGGEGGNRNIKLSARLENWTEKNNTGIAFDSSTMFQLPNGAFRSPDAAWILQSRWKNLTDEERKTFPPICPDFVVELRSETDTLTSLQKKMQEYIHNGTRLGWLIDPQNQTVEIYRQGQEKEILSNPSQVMGENILPGFVLSLHGILNP